MGQKGEGWGWSERGGAGIEWEQETKVYNHIIWQILQKEIGGGGEHDSSRVAVRLPRSS